MLTDKQGYDVGIFLTFAGTVSSNMSMKYLNQPVLVIWTGLDFASFDYVKQNYALIGIHSKSYKVHSVYQCNGTGY